MSLILRPDQVKACTTIIDAAGVGRIFGLGHIPAPGHRFTNARFALARAGIATPPAEGLSYLDILPRNVDQGPTGSCEAHAASKTLAAVFTKAGIPLGFIPSMNDLYKCRVFDRANDAVRRRRRLIGVDCAATNGRFSRGTRKRQVDRSLKIVQSAHPLGPRASLGYRRLHRRRRLPPGGRGFDGEARAARDSAIFRGLDARSSQKARSS